MNHPSPIDRKSALRGRMLAIRSSLPPSVRDAASRAIAERVTALPAWRSARVVLLHAPMGAEVDTTPLARAAKAAGKRIAWPRLSSSGRAMDLAACSLEELAPGPTRALEPPPTSFAVPIESVDLVIVPGVAFDETGRRLGRGGGHYDATLARLRKGVARVGLAFEAQIVDVVPEERHDVPMDAVVTESRTLPLSEGRVDRGSHA